MENESNLTKTDRDPVTKFISALTGGFLAIAALFGAMGLLFLAVKWVVSLYRGGL